MKKTIINKVDADEFISMIDEMVKSRLELFVEELINDADKWEAVKIAKQKKEDALTAPSKFDFLNNYVNEISGRLYNSIKYWMVEIEGIDPREFKKRITLNNLRRIDEKAFKKIRGVGNKTFKELNEFKKKYNI